MANPKKTHSNEPFLKQMDLSTTLLPFFCILALCVLFVLFPDGSSKVLDHIRFLLGDQFGSYYLLMGLGMFLCSLYMAFSRYGKIRLGEGEP